MLNVSNVQHFSVGDGAGIRTTVFLKGCNLCCPWCHNPENLKEEPAVLRYCTTGKTQILGQYLSPEELLPMLLEDRAFYEESGGGVTFSGGEAMLQARELLPLVKSLKEQAISVLIDTAGCVPYGAFQMLNPYVTGYLFDFKTADEAAYGSIGGSLALVTENLRRLKADGVSVTVRIPLIPRFNCARNEAEEICRALRELGIESVELIPFHRLGSAKYEAMGLCYPYQSQKPLSEEELCELQSIYQRYFHVKTER